MSRKFQRKIEDFICEHCGNEVKGNGYTNHCSVCFWSKHVDIFPGDRQNDCQGVMAPMRAFFKNNTWHLIHKCQKCGEERTIKIREEELDVDKLKKLIT